RPSGRPPRHRASRGCGSVPFGTERQRHERVERRKRHERVERARPERPERRDRVSSQRAEAAGVLSRMPALEDTPPQIPITRLDNGNPALLEELMASVRRIASSGAFTMGAELAAFESEFAAYCETEHAIGVSSGTEALALALRA